MNSIKQNLKESSPALFHTLRSGRDALVRMAELPSMVFHPWRLESNHRLKKYQNIYNGERCFLIGNGPSLKKTDLSLIKDEYTFGMNRIYLAFEEWGFQTSFLVSVNDLVIEQCQSDLIDIPIPKFFSWRSKDLLFPKRQPDKNTHFLYTTYTGPKFNDRITNRYWEGSTVTYVCLQLAYCMGFTEVYLIGVDHNFDTKGKANQTIISSGDENGKFQASKVGIVDERSEIAGCVAGVPQMTFGPRLDVMDACPKAEGMMMMIRSMSPDVLVVDEIGRAEDAEAISEAVNAGIKLIMTTHGSSLEEIRKRPSLKSIIDQKIFQRFIVLNRASGPGTVTHILDGDGKEMSHNKVRVT